MSQCHKILSPYIFLQSPDGATSGGSHKLERRGTALYLPSRAETMCHRDTRPDGQGTWSTHDEVMDIYTVALLTYKTR